MLAGPADSLLSRSKAVGVSAPIKLTSRFVPSLTTLSLRDVKVLSELDQPTTSASMTFGGPNKPQADIEVGKLPTDLLLASIAVSVAALCTVLYFAAFIREAICTEGFPGKGTLFSVFLQCWWTRLVLLLATVVPAATIVFLAVTSRSILVAICAGLTVVATASVLLSIHRSNLAQRVPYVDNGIIQALRLNRLFRVRRREH